MAEDTGASPKPEEPDIKALIEQVFGGPDLGNDEPAASGSPVPPAGKEGQGTAPAGGAAKTGDEMVPKARLDEALREAEKAKKWRVHIDKLEADPDSARRLLEPTQTQEPAGQVRVKPTPTAEEIEAYWRERYRQDPEGAFVEYGKAVQRDAQEAVERKDRIRSARDTLHTIREFKGKLAGSDKYFKHYSGHLDKLIDEAMKIDPRIVDADPDEFLRRARNQAFGEWSLEQRERIEAAGGTKPLPKEKSEPISAGAGAAPQTPAKPTRQPTSEELWISERYGIPVADVIAENDAEGVAAQSPWGRG